MQLNSYLPCIECILFGFYNLDSVFEEIVSAVVCLPNVLQFGNDGGLLQLGLILVESERVILLLLFRATCFSWSSFLGSITRSFRRRSYTPRVIHGTSTSRLSDSPGIVCWRSLLISSILGALFFCLQFSVAIGTAPALGNLLVRIANT